jgi:hypothetical protein
LAQVPYKNAKNFFDFDLRIQGDTVFVVENMLQAIISTVLVDSSYCMFMEEVSYWIISKKTIRIVDYRELETPRVAYGELMSMTPCIVDMGMI